MKKLFLVAGLCFVLGSSYAQAALNSSTVANRTTAVRCLKIAESCLVGNDFQSALNQSNLGISYDDSISDLYYVKATAGFKLGDKKAVVIENLKKAFDKNNWVEYTKNGARILYADLLCDTGKYEESLKLLDEEPFIYSADAEVIRVKNYYRIGSEESVGLARNKINAARRVYSSDIRFMQGFFFFESLYLFNSEIKGEVYKVPEIVQVIADSYIQHLPDYSGKNSELELLASFFTNGEKQLRLIKAIDAKEQSVQPILAIAGLRAGIYSEQQAVDLFFETTGNKIHINLLKYLVSLVNDENVKFSLSEKLTNLDCILLVDNDFDLQNELIIRYKYGRADSLSFDKDNDGIDDVTCICDLGAPESITYANGVWVDYYSYPEVHNYFINNETKNQVSFEFLKGNLLFSPIKNIKLEKFSEKLSVDFYIPEFSNNLEVIDIAELLKFSTKMESPIDERDNSRILYSMFDGQPVNAEFYDDGKMYGICNFQSGLPFVRYVDYDNDDIFETQENFDVAGSDYDMSHDDDVIAKIFSPIAGGQNLYLKKVEIDRNQNMFFEFIEEYELNGDIISIWDNDDDGIPDCRVTTFAKYNDEPKKEEVTYFNSNTGEVEITMISYDGVPVQLIKGNGEELIIFAGEYNDVYWIEKNGGANLESQIFSKIMNELNNKIVQGKGFIVQCENERVYVIEVGTTLFFRVIPEQEQVENQ